MVKIGRCAGQLGHRAVRIPAAGAGEPDRLHRAVARAAEDAAGDHHAERVRTFRGVVHEGVVEAGLSVGGALHHGRGLLRVSSALTSLNRLAGNLPFSTETGRYGVTERRGPDTWRLISVLFLV